MNKIFLLLVTFFLFVTSAFAVHYPPSRYKSNACPLLYITTEDSLPVTSKETYLNGTYYLDANGIEGIESIGSLEEQLPLQIKGRGNMSWTNFTKKPYRLKLNKKAGLLGFEKSKHFCLLAHVDRDLIILTTQLGFYLSRELGLTWTPHQVPVELVLNGEFQGLYFLTEKIRVESSRVDIIEQNDNETDPTLITGGWLLEFNNYNEEGDIHIKGRNDNVNLRISLHTPEELSDAQLDYLVNMINNIDSLINVNDKNNNEWEEYVDIDELAKYYLVNEILHDCEAFAGSCYFYKDYGENEKVKFGPVWDFGFSLFDWGGDETLLFNNPAAIHQHNHWIQHFYKFPHFLEVVKDYWNYFYQYIYPTLNNYIDDYASSIEVAYNAEKYRWSRYHSYTIEELASMTKQRLAEHVQYLHSLWDGGGYTTIDDIKASNNPNTLVDVYDIQGRLIRSRVEAANATSTLPVGFYIVNGKKVLVK